MAEAADEEVENHPTGKEETEVLYRTGSDSVTLPLLDKHRCSSDDIHKSNAQTAADGAERKTSVPQELELCDGDDRGCSGSGSSRRECPICSEVLDRQGEHAAVLLHCNHTLCHHCTTGILKRARDPSRLRCPFCRQTTPFPQWEIRRLQEELYSSGVVFYDPAPGPLISLEPRAAPASSTLCCFALRRQLDERRRLDEWTHRNVCGRCVTGLRLMRRLLPLLLAGIGCFLFGIIPIITVFQILRAD